mmetsp:Transcript_71490/g.155288  ORF Transcript_71490/g.155288 Transcript_71490/m.155288 type:complete len:182 (-) Transcript_71490:98-643(-)
MGGATAAPMVARRRMNRGLTIFRPAAALLAVVALRLASPFSFAAGPMAMGSETARSQSQAALRGMDVGATFQGRPRQPRVARADGFDLEESLGAVTGLAVFAGLGVGVLLAKITEDASISSQERGAVSESLTATLSADAGMEDVEDTASGRSKSEKLLEGMKKAQGIEEVKIKKEEVDDGW